MQDQLTMTGGFLLVITGIVLAIYISPWWLLLSAFYIIATPYYAKKK